MGAWPTPNVEGRDQNNSTAPRQLPSSQLIDFDSAHQGAMLPSSSFGQNPPPSNNNMPAYSNMTRAWQSSAVERRGQSNSTVSMKSPQSPRSSTMVPHDAGPSRYRRRTFFEGDVYTRDEMGVEDYGRGARNVGDLLAGRKRRLTAPSSPGNRVRSVEDVSARIQQNSNLVDLTEVVDRSSSASARNNMYDESMGSRSAPIDLTNMEPIPTPGSGHQLQGQRRRESDLVLPRWQPDSEASSCPVCGTPFHFFFRKHHCRYVTLLFSCRLNLTFESLLLAELALDVIG